MTGLEPPARSFSRPSISFSSAVSEELAGNGQSVSGNGQHTAANQTAALSQNVGAMPDGVDLQNGQWKWTPVRAECNPEERHAKPTFGSLIQSITNAPSSQEN